MSAWCDFSARVKRPAKPGTLRDLANADAEACVKLADCYVWGSYREGKTSGGSFEKVPVEVTLSIWDGGEQLIEIREEGTVGELRELTGRVAKKVLDATRDRASG